MMFWLNHDLSGWGYAGMAIGVVAFWILVLVATVALIRSRVGNIEVGSPHSPSSDAEPVGRSLANRFARGEIDQVEYQQRLEVLRGVTPGQALGESGKPSGL
ncbi:hypothetical protein GCM10010533_14800 [Mycolicibacterium pallens]|nr:hypothetical protein [Mycolicibacterium pallens]